jgi:hypothetical protein
VAVGRSSGRLSAAAHIGAILTAAVKCEIKWAAVGNCAIASGPRMDSEEDSVEEIRGRPHSKINFRGVTIAPQIDFIGPRTLYESTVPLAVTGIRGL